MFGTLNLISEALDVFKRAIDVRNRNIMNANNPDYAEETPELNSLYPVGVYIEQVRRDQNFYYVELRNRKLSYVSYLNERIGFNQNVEGIFQELAENIGAGDYTNRFYERYIDLMKEPTNDGAQSDFYHTAKTVVDFLKTKASDLDRLRSTADYTLGSYVRKVNDLINKIYKINKDITFGYAINYTKGEDYKNLLDERDKYLRELSELVNITVEEDDIGRVRVDTSKGFALVEFEKNKWSLEYTGGTLYWRSLDGKRSEIGSLLTGGKVKGALDTIADIDRYKGELNDIAKQLISEVKIPRANSGTWYLIKNVDSSTAALNTYGLDGNLEFYDNSTDPPTLLTTISNYGTLSLNGLANAINTDPTLTGAGFSATVVNNPDGTFTLRIDNAGNYSVNDTGGNIYESSPVFAGTGLADISLAPNLRDDLRDIDFALTDEFSEFSNLWWDNTKGKVNTLIDDIASTQSDLRKELDVEGALLDSLNDKLMQMQGVSIDREFMEIMKLQRSYEAAAKVVSTMDELLETTLRMV